MNIFEVWRWGVTCCSWTASRGARWERTCAWPRTASRPPSARFSSSTSTVSTVESTMSKNTRSSLYYGILQRKDSCIHILESIRRLEIPPFLRAFNGDDIFGTACWGRGWATIPFHSIYPPPLELRRRLHPLPGNTIVRCSYLYRVAAIFPEHFQSFTVTLKNFFFEKFFCPKPSQLCTEAK